MGISLETQAYDRIKKAILSKELKPGEKISQNDWVERLKISRTPVRDALKRLEYEQLIIRDTERQWHVYTLTLKDVHQLYEVRESVEGHLAFLAAENFTDAWAREISGVIANMEKNKAEVNHDAFDTDNRLFHKIINDAAGNSYLIAIVNQVNDRLHRLRPHGVHIEGRIEQAYKENCNIANALIARDKEKAEYFQRIHIRSSREYLILLLTQIIIPFMGPQF
jgi:DNA-binding GntR family transcriptional regulator